MFHHHSPGEGGISPSFVTVLFFHLGRQSHHHHELHIHSLQEGESKGQALNHLTTIKHWRVNLRRTTRISASDVYLKCHDPRNNRVFQLPLRFLQNTYKHNKHHCYLSFRLCWKESASMKSSDICSVLHPT